MSLSWLLLLLLGIAVAWALALDRPFRMRNATRRRASFSARLNYAAIEGDGAVMLKDGGMLAGYWFVGVDLEAATASSLLGIRTVINDMVRTLDTHWMLHLVEFHVESRKYIGGRFGDPTNALIDEERKQRARTYESHTALFVTWRPPLLERTTFGQKLAAIFATTSHATQEQTVRATQRASFESRLARLEQALQGTFPIARMRSEVDNCQLTQALEFVVNGRWRRCRPPVHGMCIDSYLAHGLATSGEGELAYGGEHVAVVSVRGYPARGTELGDFDPLRQLDFPYQWSNRFLVLGYDASRSYFSRVGKAWERMRRGLTDQLLDSPTAKVSAHADKRARQVDHAIDNVEERTTLYGHHTATIVVRGGSREEALARATKVVEACRQCRYAAEIETVNALEAWVGTFPGHGRENVCKPVLTGVHFADVGPWGRNWNGDEFCPCPFYPKGSPPLLQAVTASGEALRVNLHVGDRGHTLILGPTGAGKSALLALLLSQFGRYPGSQVFAFDKGNSLLALALAHQDGAHYALGEEGCPSLVPLADLDTADDLRSAKEWVEDLFPLLGMTLSPQQRASVHTAVEDLAASTSRAQERTLTNLYGLVQDHALREALREYTSGPASRVLNGDTERLRYRRFNVFELGTLFNMGDKVVIPTLLYLFRQCEKRLNGPPTIFSADEVWAALRVPRFEARLEEWARVLRKLNCCLVLSSNSVLDLETTRIGRILVESCPTRILLPNADAQSEAVRAPYSRTLGLRSEQIDLIAQGRPKQDYLLVTAERTALFRLDLGPVQLSFCGVSGPEDLQRLRALYAQYDKAYPPVWLEQRGLVDAAQRWRELVAPQTQSLARAG